MKLNCSTCGRSSWHGCEKRGPWKDCEFEMTGGFAKSDALNGATVRCVKPFASRRFPLSDYGTVGRTYEVIKCYVPGNYLMLRGLPKLGDEEWVNADRFKIVQRTEAA